MALWYSGGKKETNADLLDRLFDNFRIRIQLDAQCFQHIGAAALGRNTAVAMLGHGDPATGHNKCRCGRNIEGLETVNAGAAGVHHRHDGGLDSMGLFSHGPGRAGQFLKCFPFGGQGGHHGPHLSIGGLAVKNFSHHFRHLGLVQIRSADNGCQVFLKHGSNTPCINCYKV
jgi:hypothetical protein